MHHVVVASLRSANIDADLPFGINATVCSVQADVVGTEL
jgi:hypothetical protein